MLSNTPIADCPLSSALPNPSTNLMMAPEASSLNALENCSPDMPATEAKSSKEVFDLSASLYILLSALEFIPKLEAIVLRGLPPFKTA